MNLKIEDLEKEFNNRNMFEKDSQGSDFGVTSVSVASNNLI
jgi:chromosome segregation ATPase